MFRRWTSSHREQENDVSQLESKVKWCLSLWKVHSLTLWNVNNLFITVLHRGLIGNETSYDSFLMLLPILPL